MAWGTRNLVSTQGGTAARGEARRDRRHVRRRGVLRRQRRDGARRGEDRRDFLWCRRRLGRRRRRGRHVLVDDYGRLFVDGRARVEAPRLPAVHEPPPSHRRAARGGALVPGLGALGLRDVVLGAVVVGLLRVLRVGLGVRLLGFLLLGRREERRARDDERLAPRRVPATLGPRPVRVGLARISQSTRPGVALVARHFRPPPEEAPEPPPVVLGDVFYHTAVGLLDDRAHFNRVFRTRQSDGRRRQSQDAARAFDNECLALQCILNGLGAPVARVHF